MLLNVTQCYSMILNVTQCYSMLLNVTQCYSMGAASRKRETAAAPTPVFNPTNGHWSLELDSNLVLKAFMIYF